MTEAHQDYVTLGAQVGGVDAGEATSSHVLGLRRLLRSCCRGPYSSSIREFALILRIDGALDSWGKVGVAGVAVRSKLGYATADIYVPREAWAAHDAHVFRRFLAEQVRFAITAIAERAKERRVDLARERLEQDVATATEQYLAE